MILGYIRVSTKEQNLDRQIKTLLDLGVEERFLFVDHATGKNLDRPEYQLLKRAIRSGDTLYVHELDRLGRRKQDVLNELKFFKENNIIVRILDVPTTLIDYDSYGDTSKIIFDMVNSILIEVLSTMAEQEVFRLEKRQREGIDAAKEKGVRFGRPCKPFPKNWEQVYKRWKDKEITAVEAMNAVGFSKTTFYKKVREFERKVC